MAENNAWWQDEKPVDKDSWWKEDDSTKVNDKVNESIEDLLGFFDKRLIPIQVTLDIGKLPTVHALYEGDIHKTSGSTVLYCLQKMREKLF